MAKVAIIIYSTYGHVTSLAKTIQASVIDSGASADLYQVPETLPEEILTAIHAPPKDSSIPVITPDDMAQYDAFLFGFPTRFGNVPAQFTSFFDSLGGLWATGALFQKVAGAFVSTSTPGGGQEATIRNFLSFLAHHGIIYVPLGYGVAFPHLTSFDEFHGGSAWGSGTYAGGDGSLAPTNTDIEIAKIQGRTFVDAVNKFVVSEAAVSASPEEVVEEKKEAATVRTTQAKPEATEKSADEDKFCGLKCVIM